MILPANGVTGESEGAGFFCRKGYQDGFARMDAVRYEDVLVFQTESMNDIAAP